MILRPGHGGGLEVALGHRPKYDDWSFPKGKLDAGESHEDGAMREVEEETGMRCRLERELPAVRYRDTANRPKEVRYWIMRPGPGAFHPSREVDELRWVRLEEADRLLSYQHDRDLLASIDG